MTELQLQEILVQQPNAVVKALQDTSFTKLPKWSDLEKQYDPLKHSIHDVVKYPPKLNENGLDDFKRTALSLQRLAVSRVAQSMFASTVQRVYSFDRESEKEQIAVNIIEELYKIHNYIDSENIERCKKLNASCQVATVWKVYEKPNKVQGEEAKFKITHNSYSEMDGYKLYPIVDENGELLVISIGYKDTANVEYLLVYTNTISKPPEFRMYVNNGNWLLNTQVSKPLEIFPVVYLNINEPVWGGDAGTAIVEQLEEMESYQGMYIKRNTIPTFTLDYGDITGAFKVSTDEKSSDSRRILKVGKGGNMQDVTWQGAEAAIDARYQRLRNAFFEQIQVPDTSFANMIKSNTSAENKELIFADARAKAEDLAGEWEKLFYNELNIIKEFAKVIFPKYANEFDIIGIRSVIKPYSIRTKKENAEYISLGQNAMSLDTQIRILGEVDDVGQEVAIIQEERSTQSNQMF